MVLPLSISLVIEPLDQIGWVLSVAAAVTAAAAGHQKEATTGLSIVVEEEASTFHLDTDSKRNAFLQKNRLHDSTAPSRRRTGKC